MSGTLVTLYNCETCLPGIDPCAATEWDKTPSLLGCSIFLEIKVLIKKNFMRAGVPKYFSRTYLVIVNYKTKTPLLGRWSPFWIWHASKSNEHRIDCILFWMVKTWEWPYQVVRMIWEPPSAYMGRLAKREDLLPSLPQVGPTKKLPPRVMVKGH